MKLKAIILLLAMLSKSVFAAGIPPSGVFTCSGDTTTVVDGDSDKLSFTDYSSILFFPSAKNRKYALTSATPSYISKGTYKWTEDKIIHLRASVMPTAYKSLALNTCQINGVKCSVAFSVLKADVEIIDDSNVNLTILNVTRTKERTQHGLLNHDTVTLSFASCIKN